MAILLVLAIFFDRLSKVLIGAQPDFSLTLITNFLSFEHALNTQGPLGITVPGGLLLWGGMIVLIGLGVLVYFENKSLNRILILTVFAGVLSNTYDRWADGYVVDVLKLAPGLIFNIADVMILVGVSALVFINIYETRR